MDDSLQETIDTYNSMAGALADYFRSIPVRAKDVDIAFRLLGDTTDPLVVEIGCADGRDAEYISQKTSRYIGFDPSSAFIDLAQKNVPNAKFVVSDAQSFDYPDKIDIVFAFASMLHLNKEEFLDVLEKVHNKLNPGGIFYISLKLGDKYESFIKEDEYGRRLFYLYNPELVMRLAKDKYEAVYTDSGFVTGGNTKWFEIALLRK